MNLKTELKVVLMAGNVIVAESVDEQIWQSVLATITGTKPASKISPETDDPSKRNPKKDRDNEGPHDQFAAELGLPCDVVEGACAPSLEAPYIHLNSRNWEALKKNTPARGPQAITPIQLAATLLALWAKHAKLGAIGQSHAKAVLDTINLDDTNVSRGIKNCEWLQMRNGAVVVNPAETSTAIRVVAAYCTKLPVNSDS